MITYYGILQQTHEKWYSLSIDRSFGRYLRHLFWLSTYKIIKLLPPMRNDHITLIDKWETVEFSREGLIPLIGKQYAFSLSLQNIYTNGNAWWIPIISDELENLRKSLGLPPKQIPLHWGIGYEYEGKNKEI